MTHTEIHRQAEALVSAARAAGVRLTIETRSLQPLAMGNVEMFVRTWPASRGPQSATPDAAVSAPSELTVLRDTVEVLCNGLEWNIENHPTVMTESDSEALKHARAVLAGLQR